MLKIPGADQFGGKSDIPDKVKQTDWLNAMKNNGCIGCHQLGGLATRTHAEGDSASSNPRKRPGRAACSPVRLAR